MDTKMISVLILNWNKAELVCPLIDSLLFNYNTYVDIFVVDNGSTDNSVDILKGYGDSIFLIQNDKNLGGSGGFNSGLRYIIDSNRYDYVWILDNDVEITQGCLEHLIKTMDSDRNIGIVGSRIKDIHNRQYTVETGGMIGKHCFAAYPINRNCLKLQKSEKIIDADYVAICSALVRMEALKTVGLLDDRFFLFWDDMEWGLRFKSKEYRVVCSTDSIVYHNSFTERDRGALTLYYYGIRNPLMMQSLHLDLKKRMVSFYVNLRLILRQYYLLKISNRPIESSLIHNAIFDFLNDNWGGYHEHNYTNSYGEKKSPLNIETRQKDYNSYNFLFPIEMLSLNQIIDVTAVFKEIFPNSKVVLLGKQYRKNYLNNFDFISLKPALMSSFFNNFQLFLKLNKRFDAVISNQFTVYSILSDKHYVYEDGRIKSYKPLRLIKFIASYIYSEISAVISLPRLLWKSFFYNKGF